METGQNDKPEPQAPSGWLALDKPLGLSSAAAVARLKRLLPRGVKIGHGGTLDPLATGLLPIAVGEATKSVAHVMDAVKTYAFTLTFGARTETGDREGAIIAESAHRPEAAAITAILARFQGTILQTPPAYSALKIAGKPAYARARAGETVNLAPRPVTIHALRFLGVKDPDNARFEVVCGKGTYVRSLGEAIAQALETEGHLADLRRLAVGKMLIENAISLEKLEEARHNDPALWPWIGLRQALDDIPALPVTDKDAAAIRQGKTIRKEGHGPKAELWLAICGDDVVALMQPIGDSFRSVRVFNKVTEERRIRCR